MNPQEINDQIKSEMETLKPVGLSEQEQGVWIASFNAFRLADLSTGESLGAKTVVMEATAQAILSAHCDPISTISADNETITLVCSNPNSDTQYFLTNKKAAFPLWGFTVTSIESTRGVHEKIVFRQRPTENATPNDSAGSLQATL